MADCKAADLVPANLEMEEMIMEIAVTAENSKKVLWKALHRTFMRFGEDSIESFAVPTVEMILQMKLSNVPNALVHT